MSTDTLTKTVSEPTWWKNLPDSARNELLNNLPSSNDPSSQRIFEQLVRKHLSEYTEYKIPPEQAMPSELIKSIEDWCTFVSVNQLPEHVPQPGEPIEMRGKPPSLIPHGLGTHRAHEFRIQTPTEEMEKDLEFQRIHNDLKEQRREQWEKIKGKTITDWEKRNGKSIASEEGQTFLSQLPENPDSIIVKQSAEYTFREKFPQKARDYDAIEKTKIFEDPSQDPVYRQVQTGIEDAVTYEKQNAGFRGKAFDETAAREKYEKRYFKYLYQRFPEKARAYAERTNANPRLKTVIDQLEQEGITKQTQKRTQIVENVKGPMAQKPHVGPVTPRPEEQTAQAFIPSIMPSYTPAPEPQEFRQPSRPHPSRPPQRSTTRGINPFNSLINRGLGRLFGKQLGRNLLKTAVKQGAKALLTNPYVLAAIGIIIGIILIIVVVFLLVMMIVSFITGQSSHPTAPIANFTLSVNGPIDNGNNNVSYAINASYQGSDNILIVDTIPANTTFVPKATTGNFTTNTVPNNIITWDLQNNQSAGTTSGTYIFTITLNKTTIIPNDQINNQIYALDVQTHQITTGIGPTVTPIVPHPVR